MENINLSDRLKAIHKTARLFDEGDHWQKGDAFLPFVSLDTVNQNNHRAQMLNSLETENIIGEILDNEENAVFGREPDWQIMPPMDKTNADNPTPEDRLATEAEQSAIGYWDEFHLLPVLKEANRRAATQEKCFIRAYIPKGLLSDNPVLNRKRDAGEAMRLLRFEVLPADLGGVFTDKETEQKYGLFQTTTKDGATLTEICFVEKGITYVRAIKESNYAALAATTLPGLKAYMPADTRTVDEIGYDLGGELLYFEIDRKALVTESIISNQKDVNLCLTMKNRLTYQAAYRDFFFFNTKPPTDAGGNAASIKTGGKMANFMAGEDVLDSVGQNVVAYASPSMQVIEPASTDNIIKSKEASAFSIYSQCSQVHLAKSIAADASGIARRESRFQFKKKADGIAQTMNAAGRWALKVLVLFAADNLNKSNEYKSLRYDFNCRVDEGAPDPEEIKQAGLDVEKGNISEETYLSKYLRIDDADAERMRILESESYRIAVITKRLETVALDVNNLLTGEERLKIVFPDMTDAERAAYLVTIQPKANPPQPAPMVN